MIELIRSTIKRLMAFKYANIIAILAGYTLFLYLLAWSVAGAMGKLTIIEFFLTVMPQKTLGGVNILAVGVDETKYSKRSDTIMIIHLNPDENRIGVLAIPRDTRAKVPKHGLTKINHAYAYGGLPLLKESISELTNLPIHHHIRINLRGVENLIDKIGGVQLNVEKDLYYVDQAGDLYIDVKKGHQQLTGKKAISYLRFRQDSEGDIGRIRRQQAFLRALAARIFSIKDIWRAPAVISELSNNISTDMSVRELIGLAARFNNSLGSKQVELSTLPGAITLIKGVSYWRPDIVGLDQIIQKKLLGFGQVAATPSKVKTIDKTASQDKRRKISPNDIRRVSEQSDIATVKTPGTTPILVEILNGNGIPGIAQKAARTIKAKGHKVPFYGNAGSFNYDKTVIVDWKGNVEKSLKIAYQLGVDPNKIIIYDRPEKPLDITIVLGKDWNTLKGVTP